MAKKFLGLAPAKSKFYWGWGWGGGQFTREEECRVLCCESGDSWGPPLLHTQSLGEVGGDRREALNYIHGLYNYTVRFPLVVGFKGALSNFKF